MTTRKASVYLLVIFAVLAVAGLSRVALAEEIVRLKPNHEFYLKLQKRPEEMTPSEEGLIAERNLPQLLEDIEKLGSVSKRSWNPTVPKTADEAMDTLNEIDNEIEKMELVVDRFGLTRTTLISAINHLSTSDQRNQVFVSGWAPVLLGDLRLLRAREGQVRNKLWIAVALVILENQATWLDRRIQQSTSQWKMINMLERQKVKMELVRSDLHESLDEIRVSLHVIRQKSMAETL